MELIKQLIKHPTKEFCWYLPGDKTWTDIMQEQMEKNYAKENAASSSSKPRNS